MVITETVSGKTMYYGTITKGTQFYYDTMNLPIDRELILSLEADGEKLITMRGSVFFTYLYDQVMTGSHKLRFDDQPMLVKVFVQQSQDVILHLRT